MHFDERGALLILAALFGRALTRLRDGDAAFFRDGADCFGEWRFLHLHHEFEDIASCAAAEAVVDLLHRVYCE